MWHSGQPKSVLPSKAVVSLISPGFGRGFFSFGGFFFFFFLVGWTVVGALMDAVPLLLPLLLLVLIIVASLPLLAKLTFWLIEFVKDACDVMFVEIDAFNA